MTPQEIGIVYNELRTKRILFNQAVPGRRRSENEIEAAAILRRAAGRLTDIEEFLETQGLRLMVLDTASLGIPGDCLAYAVVRDPTASPPSHLCGDQVIRALMDARRDETSEQVAIWATFMTILLLYFLYTCEERPIEAVSAFKDTSVDVEDFLEEARRRIEALRTGPITSNGDTGESRRTAIVETLTSISEQRLEGRVRGFFKAMVDLGVLEKIENVTVRIDGEAEPVYRQTLWSALDLAENFRRYAPHLLMENAAELVDAVGSESEAVDGADDDQAFDDEVSPLAEDERAGNGETSEGDFQAGAAGKSENGRSRDYSRGPDSHFNVVEVEEE